MRRRDAGVSLVELIFAALILGIVATATMKAFMFMSKQSVRTGERAFATQKVIQMMEELRGMVSDTDSVIGVLDDYDNGSDFKYTLSTRPDVNGTLGGGVDSGDSPGNPLSGNGALKFKRRITINQINEPLARRVYIRVYRSSDNEVLAETVSVLRTVRNTFYPSHVYDFYVLALENVPGWWVSMSTMKPMFDNIITDLQTRNPGLVFRTHYITRMSYGRDPYYAPYINDTVRADDATVAATMKVYLYPGLLNKPSVGDFYYYVPDEINARRNVDGVIQSSTSYSMADQHNHAVRYPDEERLYAQAVEAAEAAGQPVPEVSYRMLLERLYNANNLGMDSYTGRAYDYRNAIIINMHGELVPLPPVRNYSDAAKKPATNPGVRLVTHPENVRYPVGNQVRLRVYSYLTNPPGADNALDHDLRLPVATIVVASTQPPAANITVRRMVGNNDIPYAWTAGVQGTDYDVTLMGSTATLITLYNSHLRAHEYLTGSDYGLEDMDRLYGLEYIPSLVDGSTYFIESTTSPQVNRRDLADNTDDVPKNTARWVIRINGLPTGRHDFHTRIGNTLTDGLSTDLPNLSRTYVWVGETPPITEQFQFLGDPRHMPYADVKSASVLGYNWYFNNANTGADPNDGLNRSFYPAEYPNFPNKTDRWSGGPNFDVPRLFQVLRMAIVRGNAVWSSITGFSSFYVGLGGEMGYDTANGFPDSLPIISRPWSAASVATNQTVQEITSASGGSDHNYSRVISNAADTWWGLHWLGEMYPDSAFASWSADGNLPIGAGNFYRKRYNAVGLSDSIKRTAEPGSASFFNGNPAGGSANWFMHSYWADTDMAALQTDGNTMAVDFNFPLAATMASPRPFRLDSTSNQPPEWNAGNYPTLRTTLSRKELWYKRSGFTEDTSALVRVLQGGQAGGVVMNGVDDQSNTGAATISKLCAIGLLRGFMLLGEPAVAEGNIPQLPLITISSPTVTDEFEDPSDINVIWSSTWTRWDTNRYTTGYPVGYSGASTIIYNVKISRDNGRNWTFAGTTDEALVGVLDDTRTHTSPYLWSVPSADYPTGNYIIRVEAYRQGRRQHYSQHQRRVFIRR